jgi:hypothetical protein
MTGHNLSFSFDSTTELVSALTGADYVVAKNAEIYSDFRAQGGWICADRRGVKTKEDALKALSVPLFDAGVARIEKATKELTIPAIASIKRRIVRGPEGDELDMQRVWQGDLDLAWSRAKRTHVATNARVLLCVFVGAPGGAEASEVAWRGVAALALASALIAAGYTVNVRAIRRARFIAPDWREFGEHNVDVTIKGDSEHLDIHRAASLVASTLLFRGPLLLHAAKVAPLEISSGVTKTNYAAQTHYDATGYDAHAVAGESVNSASAAQSWINEQVRKMALSD